MKAVIIGACGYVGKHLTRQLELLGWDLTLYDFNVEKISQKEVISLDIRDKNACHAINIDVDFIFFMSGVTGTSAAYQHYERYIDVNEKGLLNVLDVLKNRRSKARVIFPSTRLVYKGIKDKSLSETAEKEFKTIYALNKWAGEQLLNQYSNYFGIEYTIVRICVPYGTLFGDGYSYGTVGFFLSNASAGRPISLYGDGAQKRTFTHVEDVCTQIVLLLQQNESRNEIFNIAGEVYSLSELASMIAKKFGGEVRFSEWPEIDLKIESGDTIFDGSKILGLIKQKNKHTVQSWLNNLPL